MKTSVITISPDILSGTPVFCNTRVPIKNLFDYLETGETVDDFLDDFPTVTREQVLQVLESAEHLITSAEYTYESPVR
jgi:uncharacterized protein (DUF433 family)